MTRGALAWRCILALVVAIFAGLVVAGFVRWAAGGEVPAEEIAAAVLFLALNRAGVYLWRKEARHG